MGSNRGYFFLIWAFESKPGPIGCGRCGLAHGEGEEVGGGGAARGRLEALSGEVRRRRGGEAAEGAAGGGGDRSSCLMVLLYFGDFRGWWTVC